MNTETRSLPGVMSLAEGRTLVGYGAVFDSPTTVREGGKVFTEVIRQGAFKRALASGGDIISCFNHDPNRVLGRLSAGTLRLQEDGKGLRFEVDLPQHAADVKEMIQRGDVGGCSFTFSPKPDGMKWTGSTREITDMYLLEVGPVTMPAYRATTVGIRSHLPLMKMKLWLAEKS